MKKLFRPWPRWAKIVRNLTVTVMLVPFIWMCLGAPLTAKGELRRFERRCLLPPGEIVLEFSDDKKDDIRVQYPSPFYVSVSDYAMVTVDEHMRWMDPLTGDGPELFLLKVTPMWVSKGTPKSSFAYILVHPPENAVRAVLSVTTQVYTYTAKGTFTDGAVFFIMPSPIGGDYRYSPYWEPNACAWEITYYDAQGNSFEV